MTPTKKNEVRLHKDGGIDPTLVAQVALIAKKAVEDLIASRLPPPLPLKWTKLGRESYAVDEKNGWRVATHHSGTWHWEIMYSGDRLHRIIARGDRASTRKAAGVLAYGTICAYYASVGQTVPSDLFR